MLIISINQKDEEMTLEEYHSKSLYSILYPMVFISFTVIISIFYLIYRLYTELENMLISEILFLISIIIGLFNTAKSIVIIFNNYYKAKAARYGVTTDVTLRLNLIYKSLITNNEYSNIEIILLWIIPVIYTLFIIILNILITYYLQSSNCTDKTGLDITLKDIIDFAINKNVFNNCKQIQ
jgi:hypothetical protein